jgi:hypothetical protein
MGFRYNPKDAADAAQPGDYEATLTACTEGTSKSSGSEMLTLTFVVYADRERTIKDYIVNPDGLWKLKKLAIALGHKGAFDAGTFDPADHLNSNLMVTLKVEESAEFGDQNKIGGYKPLARSQAQPQRAAAPARAAAAQTHEPVGDDDIPF